jgi:hypothetical protein
MFLPYLAHRLRPALRSRLSIIPQTPHRYPLHPLSFNIKPTSLTPSVGSNQNPLLSKFPNTPAGRSSHTQAATAFVACTVKFPVSSLCDNTRPGSWSLTVLRSVAAKMDSCLNSFVSFELGGEPVAVILSFIRQRINVGL